MRLRNMLQHKRLSQALLCFSLLGMLTACAGDKKDELVEKPVHELYDEATKAFDDGDFKLAAKNFEEVERQYPYSEWATRAQLMAAYAQYSAQDYDSATATLDRFIQLHPGHERIAYAFYLRALCFYERIADIVRDQTYTREAEKALREVISRFPDTPYAKDAEAKFVLVQDQLAAAEMEVGRYYLKRQLYGAALPRFQTVVEKFQTTSQVPEALHRMVETTLALGITKEAQAVAAVLGYNYPGSDWYQLSYQLLASRDLAPAAAAPASDSWIGRIWKKLL
jgi:outer membrane protein assembly factor BamD